MLGGERQFIVYVDNIILDNSAPQIVTATNGPELLQKACDAMKIKWPPDAINFPYKLDIWSARMGIIRRYRIGTLQKIPDDVTTVWLRAQI